MGKLFEDTFQNMCISVGLAITRFPDGCRSGGLRRLIRVKTPWDWILTYRNHASFLDTKTNAEATFPHSKIEKHQVEEMMKHRQTAICGYVCWLREVSTVIFVPAVVLYDKLGVRGSIAVGDHGVVTIGELALVEGTEDRLNGELVLSRIFSGAQPLKKPGLSYAEVMGRFLNKEEGNNGKESNSKTSEQGPGAQ